MKDVLGDIVIGLCKVIGKIFLFLMWTTVRLVELLCGILAKWIKNMLTTKER